MAIPPRWFSTAIVWSCVGATVKLVVTTNTPTHLWVRYTSTLPQIHSKSVRRRGILIMSELRFCFVEFQDIEQTEPGDTTAHTWTWPDWPFCTIRFLYFFGTIAGVTSPSTTPYIEYHNTCKEVLTLVYSEPWHTDNCPFGLCPLVLAEPWSFLIPAYTLAYSEPWSS